MKWIENLTKFGALIITIIGAVFYFGGNQANIQNSISNNSKKVIELKQEIKEGNSKIISLLEKSKDKQQKSDLQIVENKNNILWIMRKR